uniref:Uncharacterized protein n=1 Tax=Anguilla anguilla TaxID=7936 RepID=A0A0E9QJW5_ANGAN
MLMCSTNLLALLTLPGLLDSPSDK